MQKLSSIHSNFIFITYIICNRPETLRFSLERSYRSITSHFSINHENLSRREKKKKNGHSPGGDQLTGYAWRGPSFRAPRGALVQPELPARDSPEHAAPSPGASTPEAEPAATRSSRGARAAPGSVLAALAAGTSVLWTDRAPRLVNLVCQGREGGGGMHARAQPDRFDHGGNRDPARFAPPSFGGGTPPRPNLRHRRNYARHLPGHDNNTRQEFAIFPFTCTTVLRVCATVCACVYVSDVRRRIWLS